MAGKSFDVGTVVMLKSGGPALTVTTVDRTGVTVTWYSEKSEEFKTQLLPATILEEVDFADDEIEDD